MDEGFGLSSRDENIIPSLIRKSSSQLENISIQAKRALNKKKYGEVFGLAQIYGTFAWQLHAGYYVSAELEKDLIEVAQSLKIDKKNVKIMYEHPKMSKRKVLHVITQPTIVGGHTRYLQRFIRSDMEESLHCIAVTGNSDDIPMWLNDAARVGGGSIIKMDKIYSNPLEAAAGLREFGEKWADVVFLYSHPNDPLPLLAFGKDGGAKIVIINHADHVFWLGASIADLVAEIRPAGQKLSFQRRGIIRSKILPIPLLETEKELARKEAREILKIENDTTVLLSAASEYKYRAMGQYDFLEIHRDVLDRVSNVVLLVIGPERSGRWEEYYKRTNGRIRPLGKKSELNLYWAVADIYLDSLPFASLTSMLEVGLLKRPLIGMKNEESAVLSSDDISLNRCGTNTTSIEKYKEELIKLISNQSYREERGANIGREIRRDHLSDGWLKYLGSIYGEIGGSHSINPLVRKEEKIGGDDLMLRSFQEAWGSERMLFSSLYSMIRNYPFNLRFELLVQNICKKNIFDHRQIPLREFLSEGMISKIKKMRAVLFD